MLVSFIVLCESYRVVWDEREYILESYRITETGTGYNRGICIGNASLSPYKNDMPNTGERVLITYTGGFYFYTSDIGTQHTVSLYLNDKAATKSFVINYVEQYINEALGGEY